MKVSKLVALIIFGMAFGMVEAAVVVYLRSALGIHIHGSYALPGYHTLLNLGAVQFVVPHGTVLTQRFTRTEMLREAATLVMLLCVAFVAAQRWRQRLGAFLIAFAGWDLAYYGFLKLLIGWPGSLKATDVFFLLPVMWIGPVVTALVASLVLLGVGLYLGATE